MSSAKIKSAKTMRTGNKENCKPVKKSKLPLPVENNEGKKMKAKPAPDFSKLHTKWNHKLQMGKACVKKPCTVSQEFNLTRPGSKFMTLDGKEVSEVGLTGDVRQCFTPDAKSMKDLELERELTPSKQTGRATIATSRINTEKSRNIQAERPLDRLNDQRPPAKRSKPNTHSMAEEQEDAGLQFEPDKTALISILTNSGIENRQSNFTPNKQFPRSSIYYQPQNRVSLFDSCMKKRLLNAPNEVRKLLESDRICTSESPYVKGPVAKCPRNSVFPDFIKRKLLTPTTPKTNSVNVMTPVQAASTAGRVRNPNFKPVLSPSQCSNSVKKIRKTLRWGDILSSPECTLPTRTDKVVNDDVTAVSLTDQCPDACVTTARDASLTGGSVSSVCVSGVSSTGLEPVCPPVSIPATAVCELTGVCSAGAASGRVGDDSSVKAGVSHPSLNNTGSSSSIGGGGNPPLPTTPACHSSTHIVSSQATSPPSHTPGHDIARRQPLRSSSSSVSLLVQPGATAAGSSSGVGIDVVAEPVPAMIDIVSTVATHPGDVSCQRQLQSLEEKERRLLWEMQQLSMAMSDEHKKDDNDNSHHHHHQPHPQHETQQQQQQHHEHHHPQLLHQQHPHLPHPDTSVDVIQHLITTPFSSQPSIPYQRMPHTMTTISEHSHVRTTQTHSSVTQGLELGVPSDINLNLTLPSTSQDPAPTFAAAAQGLSLFREGTEGNQAQMEIQRQLLAVQQHQQELLRIQQELEMRLRGSQMSRGPAAGLQVQSDQSERNNNTDDLKCNIQSIPPSTGPALGPAQQACRQEESQIKSGDINDNYQPSCVTTSSAGAAQSPVLDSSGSSKVEPVNTLSSEVHAGRGQTAESDTSSSSICQAHTGDSAPQSEQTESHESSTIVATEGQQQPLPFSSDTDTGDRVTGESVRRDSSAPLDLRTPCKLPRVRDELELTTPNTSDSIRKSDPHVPGTFVAVDLSMPEPYRPSQAHSGDLSPETIMPPIWTPLALKVAASRSSPKDDDSSVPSAKKTVSGDKESSHPSSERSSVGRPVNVSDSKDASSKSETCTQGSSVQQGLQSSDQVVPASVKLVTTCLTSVTLSEGSPLPAKQARRSDTNIYLDALLDDECALFTCRLQTFFQDVSEQDRGVMDPVARTLLEGDEMHFVPIRDDTVAAPLEGSAFAAYSPV